MDALVLVVNEAGTQRGEGPSVIARIHAVGLAEDKPGICVAREINHPSWCGPVAAQARGGGVALAQHVGILDIRVAQVVFAVEIEAKSLFQFERGTPNLGRRGQTVLEADDLQVGIVLNIALGLGD